MLQEFKYANDPAKKEHRQLLVDTIEDFSQKRRRPVKSLKILLFDSVKLDCSRLLIERGANPTNIYVVEGCWSTYTKMCGINKKLGINVKFILMEEFLNSTDEIFDVCYLDYMGTFYGNKYCKPNEEIDTLLWNHFNEEGIAAFNLTCSRSKTSKETIEKEIHDIYENNGFKGTGGLGRIDYRNRHLWINTLERESFKYKIVGIEYEAKDPDIWGSDFDPDTVECEVIFKILWALGNGKKVYEDQRAIPFYEANDFNVKLSGTIIDQLRKTRKGGECLKFLTAKGRN